MASNLYVTAAEVKATLDLTSLTYADDDVDMAVEAASRAVETLTGRDRFYVADLSNDETRYYTAYRPLVLEIEDATVITSIKTDDDDDGVYETTWVADTDYRPYRQKPDWPIEQIRVLSRSNYSLPLGRFEAVQIIGQFGWTTVPSGVSTAALKIASKLVREFRDAPFGVLAFGETAVRIGQTDPTIRLLLQPFDRTAFAV